MPCPVKAGRQQITRLPSWRPDDVVMHKGTARPVVALSCRITEAEAVAVWVYELAGVDGPVQVAEIDGEATDEDRLRGPEPDEVCVRIREARKAKGWTQKQLGRRIGCSGAWVCQTELSPKQPSFEDIRKIAAALDSDYVWLCTGMTLEKAKECVRGSLFYGEDETEPQFHTAVMMFCAFFIGSNIDTLAAYTGYDREWMEPKLARLRGSGIFPDESTVHCHWPDDDGEAAFLCDYLVAEGLCTRSIQDDGQMLYTRTNEAAEALEIIGEGSAEDTPALPGPPPGAGWRQRRDIAKNPDAVAMGKLGGKKGGKARAARLSAEQRQAISRAAAFARWGKKQEA